jgi:ribosomal protein S12 methylthiotransferase accessory factor
MQHIEELNASDAILFRGKSYRARKQFWHGTQRTISPQETLERIRPHFKIVGLSRLSNITGLDRIGIPNHACHPSE